MEKLILASASPRRKELLEQVGAVFDIVPAKGEEVITKSQPSEVVVELALQKAREVVQGMEEGMLVLGADTVVSCNGKILGKPHSRQEAVEMLTMLSGSTHSVYTGVALIRKKAQGEEVHHFYEETRVTMYPMSREEIEAYVESGEPMDKAGVTVCNTLRPWEGKAGAYGIQDAFGMKYIKEIKGDYYNVVGLPVSRILFELRKIGIALV